MRGPAFWLVLVALIGGLGTLVWWGHVDREVLDALLFAITFVVITCPDALGLATPTAIMVGAGLGARRGILFKNALAIEQSAGPDTVALDKTGTLTRGVPEVVEIAGDGRDHSELLRLVAAIERESEHPLAEAIVKAAEQRGVERLRAERFESVVGHGAVATVDGRRVLVGNRRLLEREHVSLDGLAAPADAMAGAGRTPRHGPRGGGRDKGTRHPPGHAHRRQPPDRRTDRSRARDRAGAGRGATRR
jgi:P-type Cu2+ transporter